MLEDNVYLSGNSAIHQFVRVGRLALLSGLSGTSKDIPPFIIQQRINCVMGVNVIGMRRAGIPVAHIDAVRRAYHVIYREEHDRLAGAESGLDVVHTLTRVQPPGWAGRSRRIDKEMLAEVAWPVAERPLAYVCGPTPLVESVARDLVDLGHEAGRVKTERFGPTGG